MSKVELTDGGGEWVGKQPNHTSARKHGPLYIIQYPYFGRHTGRLEKRDKLLKGEGGEGGGRGAESYDRRKAWPSINRSILSGIRSPDSFQLF